MSGGRFDYKQFELQRIADDIEQFIVDPQPKFQVWLVFEKLLLNAFLE